MEDKRAKLIAKCKEIAETLLPLLREAFPAGANLCIEAGGESDILSVDVTDHLHIVDGKYDPRWYVQESKYKGGPWQSVQEENERLMRLLKDMEEGKSA